MSESAPEVVYEVNTTVTSAIREAYLAWLPGHVAALLQLDGFKAARICELEPDASGDGARHTFVCTYRIRSRAALQAYFDGPAAAMRADALGRFGDQFSATRRTMEVRLEF